VQLTYRGINYKPTFLSNTITPSKKGKSVQLTYRGINHEASDSSNSDSPTNIASEVITGKYRGIPMPLRLSLEVA
jgi:Domain of unknown function (DUF4278)